MKNKNLKLLSTLVLCVCYAGVVQGEQWRGIIPLKSTRADVEKLLGKPNELGRYELEGERVYIDYSKGCDDKSDCLCLAPKDTVISIFVTVESKLKLSDLKLDRTKFKKRRGGHLPSIVTYTDDEGGISYSVDEDDQEVIHITYLPSRRDCKNLTSHARTKKQHHRSRSQAATRI